MPSDDALGGDDQVRSAGDHGIAREAAAGDDRDAGHQRPISGPRGRRRGSRAPRRPRSRCRRAALPALGEEDGRQAHPLDQLEQPVLLLVPEGALRAREHRVVIGEDGARRGLVAEEIAVDAGGAGDQPVGRRPLDQLLQIAPAALRGDRVTRRTRRSVPGSTRSSRFSRAVRAAGGVAALDGLGPRRVVREAAGARGPPRGRRGASRRRVWPPARSLSEPSANHVPYPRGARLSCYGARRRPNPRSQADGERGNQREASPSSLGRIGHSP